MRPLATAAASAAAADAALDWTVELAAGLDASKSRLLQAFKLSATPDLLFTASHGLGFPSSHPLQLRHQGALLCQDWPGPLRHRGAIPPEFYFSGDDLPAEACASGMIAFNFACFGGWHSTVGRLLERWRQAWRIGAPGVHLASAAASPEP